MLFLFSLFCFPEYFGESSTPSFFLSSSLPSFLFSFFLSHFLNSKNVSLSLLLKPCCLKQSIPLLPETCVERSGNKKVIFLIFLNDFFLFRRCPCFSFFLYSK